MKKGLLASQAVSLIIAALAVITLWMFIQDFIDEAPEATKIQSCRASLAIKNAADSATVPSPPNVCATIDADETQNALQPNQPDENKKKIAEMASRCWYMFYQGNLESVFTSSWSDEGSVGCHICYSFTTPSDMQTINASEMYRYLLETDYQPSQLIKTTGAKYRGDGVENVRFHSLNTTGETTNIDDIVAQEVNSFVSDYPGVLSDTEEVQISETAVDLFNPENTEARQANIYVLITSNVDSMTRSGSHQLMDQMGLNTPGEHNGMLLWIDVGRGEARLDYGRDIQPYLPESEAEVQLEPLQTNSDITESIRLVLTNIGQKLNPQGNYVPPTFIQENPDSYLAYLSGPGKAPLIATIEPGQEYAVTYFDIKQMGGFEKLFQSAGVGAGAGVAVAALGLGVAAYFSAPVIAVAATTVKVGAVVGGLIGYDTNFLDSGANGCPWYSLDCDEKADKFGRSLLIGKADVLYRQCHS